MSVWDGRLLKGIYRNQTDYSEDGHENAGPFTQCQSVDLYEGLRGVQSEEDVQIWNAEQEEDSSEESHDSGE
jgi:hypothetical protein